MQIDLRTVAIKPVRQTFDHIARRFGDKPASRYQEGTYDIQQTDIFHYRPMWEPELKLFDERRTQLKMADWYALKDPRQYYYGAYTIARARQQEAAESSFEMIEERGLAYPMFYDYLDGDFSAQGGTAISMMTRFMAEWSAETAKWVDAQIKVAAAESADNKALLGGWVRQYRGRTLEALAPLARRAFGDGADQVLAEVTAEFNARCAKAGLSV